MIVHITSIDTFELSPQSDAEKAILKNLNQCKMVLSCVDGKRAILYVHERPDDSVEALNQQK